MWEPESLIVGFTKEVNEAIAQMVVEDVETIPFHFEDGTEVPLGIGHQEGEVVKVVAKYRGMLDVSSFDSRFDPGNGTMFVFETLDENDRVDFFYVGMGKASTIDPTQLPVVFVHGDIPSSGLIDAQREIVRPKARDLYDYLIRRFSAMEPG